MTPSARTRLLGAFGDTSAALRRIDDYYLPVFDWIASLARTSPRRPLVLGLHGPQGSGKSTLAAFAEECLALDGLRAVAVSIDDFYLPHDAQRALAEAHPGNRYLEHRGYPGTHDIELGAETLRALRALGRGTLPLPGYDKGAFDGRGDRLPRERWRLATGPLDVVIVEGWMLAFTPVADDALPDVAMRPANEALARYAAWQRELDALVVLEMASSSFVVEWRVDSERQRRAREGRGLTDDEARDYVERFLPAYATWGPPLRERSPIEGPTLHVTLGANRLPIGPVETPTTSRRQ